MALATLCDDIVDGKIKTLNEITLKREYIFNFIMHLKEIRDIDDNCFDTL
jgi:hypothetical protein